MATNKNRHKRIKAREAQRKDKRNVTIMAPKATVGSGKKKPN